MGFSFWSIIEAVVLVSNAVAILHEERFLAKIGWGRDQIQGFGTQEPSVKSKIIEFLKSVRTLTRVPLIFVNIVVIGIKLIMG